MDRKLLNEVDGFAVDEYQGTFTGTFDVRGVDAKYLAYDDEVLLVVRARVKPPRLKELKNGDIVRVNVLGVKEGAVVRSEELKKHLCDTMGLEIGSPQLTLDEVLSSNGDSSGADQGLPEVLSVQGPDPDVEDETAVEVFSPAATAGPGPKVVRFRPDESMPDVPVEVEQIALKTTKDPKLAAFLAETS
jgi:hypothetical protein